MKMKKVLISLIVIVMIFIIHIDSVMGQNTAVTDNESYTPHSSAILDVYSLSKGLLVPRLTSTQRSNITSPADGLLVYDTDADTYYYFANTAWHPIDAPSLWSENSDTVYITGVGKRYGVGTASPVAKLTVQGDATIAADEPLFEVKNSTGDVIFAVYENEVQVNFKEGAKGVKGGFAVGGLSGSKATPTEYMRITPDSTRIYINDAAVKGVKGGFAVGGLSGTKNAANKYFMINDDSARIYLKDPAKGVKGGFAVGGLSGTKGTGVNFLDLTPDNYFIGHNAGQYTTGVNNSFIGFEAGYTNTTGFNNVFIGRKAGYSNINGYNNMFFGNESGLSNISGEENTFIGLQSGYSNTTGRYNIALGSSAGSGNIDGFENVYIGFNAGKSSNSSGNVAVGSYSGYQNLTGYYNTFIGMHAGWSSTGVTNTYIGYSAGGNGSYNVAIGGQAATSSVGNYNVFMGHQVALSHTSGSNNVMIGYQAGRSMTTGSGNIFLGKMAGYSETGSDKLYIDNSSTAAPLIYGDFSLNDLVFNGDVNITGTLTGGKSFSYKTDLFEQNYELVPLGDYVSEIKDLGHLPGLQSLEDINANGVNYSKQIEGLVNELQKAYLYIEELNKKIERIEKEMSNK